MTTEPEAIPAEVRELARRLADENELSLFNEDLIVHAILSDRASRAELVREYRLTLLRARNCLGEHQGDELVTSVLDEIDLLLSKHGGDR